MTSIEALDVLIIFLKPEVWKDGFEYRNLETGEVKTIDEIYNIICNDIKILEILKKYIYYSPKSHCIRMREIRKSTNNFDYEYLKEKLKNE